VERLKTPSDAQKHEMAHNDVGKSSSKRNVKELREVDRVEEFPQSPLVRRLIQQDSPVVARNPVFLRGERGRNIRVF
jgi:hypothetical protein